MLKSVATIVACLIVLGIIGSALDSDKPEKAPTQEQPTVDAGEPAAPAKPTTPYADAKAELDHRFGDRLRGVSRTRGVVFVRIDGEEGFTNGMTLAGMETDAGDAFAAVYMADAFPKRRVVVQVYLELVDTATGQKSEGIVNTFVLTAGDAERIDWTSASSINWEVYRTFKHPALD